MKIIFYKINTGDFNVKIKILSNNIGCSCND